MVYEYSRTLRSLTAVEQSRSFLGMLGMGEVRMWGRFREQVIGVLRECSSNVEQFEIPPKGIRVCNDIIDSGGVAT